MAALFDVTILWQGLGMDIMFILSFLLILLKPVKLSLFSMV